MRVGILGSGQLGRMLALAAHPLGHSVHVLGESAGDPAMAVAIPTLASYDDVDAVARFSGGVDVVTFEFENIPPASLAAAAARTQAWPPPRALEIGSDRLLEKTMFTSLGVGTAPFRAVDDQGGLERAVGELGRPAVLKTRRLGYDGKGQKVLRTAADVVGAFAELGSVPCVLEGFVSFSRELSVIAARDVRGNVVAYPLVENRHEGGILRVTRAPATVPADVARRAEEIVKAVLDHLGYVGVLAVELFDVGGELFANEIAPRVHNTGHFTIEGAETSQFEQHVRAITGAPLGAASLRGASAMVNLVGGIPERDDVLAIPGAHLHLYGKSARPGRKVGHVTITGLGAPELEAAITAVRAFPGGR